MVHMLTLYVCPAAVPQFGDRVCPHRGFGFYQGLVFYGTNDKLNAFFFPPAICPQPFFLGFVLGWRAGLSLGTRGTLGTFGTGGLGPVMVLLVLVRVPFLTRVLRQK